MTVSHKSGVEDAMQQLTEEGFVTGRSIPLVGLGRRCSLTNFQGEIKVQVYFQNEWGAQERISSRA